MKGALRAGVSGKLSASARRLRRTLPEHVPGSYWIPELMQRTADFVARGPDGLSWLAGGGQRLLVPRGAAHMYHRMGAEIISLERFSDACRGATRIADVGANAGIYTLTAAAAAPDAEVHAFEPMLSVRQLLRTNLQAVTNSNVHVHKTLAGDRDGTVTIHEAEKTGHHSIYKRPEMNTVAAHRSPMIRLDSLAPFDVVKIDVEGAEMDVLDGMEGWGDDLPRDLFIEFVPPHLRAAGRDPHDLLERLTDWGYDLALIDERSERVGGLSQARALIDEPGIPWTNLHCRRV